MLRGGRAGSLPLADASAVVVFCWELLGVANSTGSVCTSLSAHSHSSPPSMKSTCSSVGQSEAGCVDGVLGRDWSSAPTLRDAVSSTSASTTLMLGTTTGAGAGRSVTGLSGLPPSASSRACSSAEWEAAALARCCRSSSRFSKKMYLTARAQARTSITSCSGLTASHLSK
uniref:Putative secreted protein n=1 Tax=Ixodes ricinus TaxID=34613 RepID=A0A6B0UY82_IXORI